MASKIIAFDGEKYALSYEIIAPSADNNSNLNSREILFLHGWGANKELMQKAFAPHFADFRQIYLDLPGFGGSEIHGPLTSADYAAIVSEFIKAAGLNPLVIAGHSFGGKVALLLNPPILALLSSAGIVCQKPLAVRAKIAIFKTLKKLGFGGFYRLFATKDVAGMSRVMYETLKNVVDEDFSPKFEAFSGRALIFWGESDTATPLSSGRKIARLIKNSEFYPLGGDHFFFLSHGEFIADTIRAELSNLKTGEDNSNLNCADFDDEDSASFCPCCGGAR